MNGQANWVRVSWMAAALLPLVAGLAGAANPNSTQPQTNQPIQQDQQVAPTPGPTAQYQPKLERAKNLIGVKIVNDQGERLGKVEDIVLTPNRDAVHYVVLAHGGTWGVGDKYFAVPWSQFNFRPGETAGQGILVLKNVTNADLDKAPGFDKNHWPTVANENWLGIERGSTMAPSGGAAAQAPQSSVEERTGTVPEESPESMEPMATEPPSDRDQADTPGMTPEGEMSADTGYGADQPVDIEHLRLHKLMGIDIRNLQNENLGKLDNVMIDLNQGKLAYGIVAIRSGFLGLNKDFVAVPWSVLDLRSQPGIARLDADKQTLTAIAFDKDNFPNLEDPQYSRQLFERFHATPYWESQNLGFIPGQENRNVNPPSSGEKKAPGSGMTAPNAAPNAATEERIAQHMDKHALSYNPNTVETIRGKVTSVGTYPIEGISTGGVLLHVRTDEGRTLRVQVAPRPFLDGQNISFRAGDPVTITGSLVKAGEHEILLASQIQTANRTLDLRAADGKPLWNLDQYRSSASASAGTGDRHPYEW